MHKVFLTFDIEDFINDNSVWVLERILEILKKNDLKALFFITGYMAEKIRNFPSVVDLLNEHQIGYHSSSHSVHPTIFEFTDVDDYEKAYEISLRRETAHIDPLTGKIVGKGGLLSLREVFHKKEIKSFRAPGHCWSAPHLEALRTLGISFDFSANLSPIPVFFKNLTFYPYPILGQWQGSFSEYWILLLSLIKNEYNVITFHPSLLVNKREWDSVFWSSNPKQLTSSPPQNPSETRYLIRNLELLLKRFGNIQEMHSINILSMPEVSHKDLVVSELDIGKCYSESMRWAFKQKYMPRFLFNHFLHFFKTTESITIS